MNTSAPIPVDFGNADEDGAIRLVTRGTLKYCEDRGIVLSDGTKVAISDGEVTAEGVVSKREGFWVVTVEKWVQ